MAKRQDAARPSSGGARLATFAAFPGDELAGLRRLVAALKSKSLVVYENKQDVTARETWKLENNVRLLETVLKRVKAAS